MSQKVIRALDSHFMGGKTDKHNRERGNQREIIGVSDLILSKKS